MARSRQLRSFALSLVLSSLFGLSRAAGCDCGPAGPSCAYVGRAAVVFAGTVVFSDHDPTLGLRQRTFVKFKIDEAFKGLTPSDKEVWIDPGSFTSCYAEYNVGEHSLVFGYEGDRMPPDTALMSVVPGQPSPKPIPGEIVRNGLPTVYSSPECSGTRSMRSDDPGLNQDLGYLRQFRDRKAGPSIRGRVTEDENFGIFDRDPRPGLKGVTVIATGNGPKRTTTTDNEGFFALEDLRVGSYLLTALLRPYKARWPEREVEVPAAGCGAADFDMFAPGSIDGVLLDSKGKPASNVRVEVLRLNAQGRPIFYAEKKTTTGRDGRYHFTELPHGNFQIGVNVFEAPDPDAPYAPTKWSAGIETSVNLKPGERKLISPFRLPDPLAVRTIAAVVRWPDGRAAQGADLWGDFGDRVAAHGEVKADGSVRMEVLESLTYSVEAKIWTGPPGHREVARTGSMELTPGKDPIHLELTLNKRTQQY